jgi:adenine phosphoribosyltransferase
MIDDTLDRLMRDVPDFPKPGIVFKDITPLLADAAALKEVASAMAEPWRGKGITHILGVESRGFIFGTAVAMELGVGLVLVRKPGKLPCPAYGADYTLEYGTDRLEMHKDALDERSRVVILDDVLATGGTAGAVAQLVAQGGGQLAGFGFLLELGFLSGREKLPADSVVESLRIL